MAGTIIKRYVFIHPCSWNIFEHCRNGRKIHAWEKCGVCRFGIFIAVRYLLGKRVNFKHFLVRLQDGKTCGNFCLVLVDNVLWYNPMRIFLRPCWSHCLPVLFNFWKHQTFWLNHCGIWRSWVVRYMGWDCVSAGMMWVWQRRCWNRILGTFAASVQWYPLSWRSAPIVVLHFIQHVA